MHHLPNIRLLKFVFEFSTLVKIEKTKKKDILSPHPSPSPFLPALPKRSPNKLSFCKCIYVHRSVTEYKVKCKMLYQFLKQKCILQIHKYVCVFVCLCVCVCMCFRVHVKYLPWMCVCL